MIETFTEFEKLVRDQVFENVDPSDLFAFSLAHPDDASANGAGDLFAQNQDFLLFESSIETVRRAGPGTASPRRAWGTLLIGVVTKKTHNRIAALSRLEEVAGWFGSKTIGGVRFRELLPVEPSPLMGFTSHDGVIHFDFELKAT